MVGLKDRTVEIFPRVMEVHKDATKDKAKEVRSQVVKKEKEVKERLQVLNAKKHNLIQVLKQILNAEEELKRRSSCITRLSLPLHVNVSNDSGGNAGTHMEAGETDDAGNAQTLIVLRLCGASSSSESPLRRAAAFSQHNMAPHPSRWSPRLVPSQPGIRALQEESLFQHLEQTTLLHLLHQLVLVALLFSEKHGYRVHGISSFSFVAVLTSSFF